MIQGTGSNVGKSMIVAGLCRAAVRRGIKVVPFKPQNMSNNAAVTVDGGEIGRAQALQALACKLPTSVDMNPVLLKPEGQQSSQVIVQGKHLETVSARGYAALKPRLLPYVLESYQRLERTHGLVLVEGAGSPAEMNLRANDIANMGFAHAANLPVVLAGDIDRGGVIAQLVGTHAILPAEDESRIKGFLINKFRGDPRLFDDGYKMIEEYTGWRGFGVVPYFAEAWKLPAEDGQDLLRYNDHSDPQKNHFHIVCLGLPHIANFDDLDPLAQEPGVTLTLLKSGESLPATCDLVIIPGSKATRQDLIFLKDQGWDIDLMAHMRRGGNILGLCGGYQMLGSVIRDPEGLEGFTPTSAKSSKDETAGLNLLQVETILSPQKHLTRVQARHSDSGLTIDGYEIHLGKTDGPDCARPFATIIQGDKTQKEGACSENGQIQGTYLHGLFTNDDFRAHFLRELGVTQAGSTRYEQTLDETLNALADHLEAHLDLPGLFELAGG